MPIIVSQKRAESRSRYYTREEAKRIGWDLRHPTEGGQFLEEQELVDYFPALRTSLGLERPDFGVLSTGGLLAALIECKNDYRELDVAVSEAQGYAESISSAPGFNVRVAVGVAGTPDKLVRKRVMFRLHDGRWVPLSSHGFPLTQLPTPTELITALQKSDGTTDVELPSEREFFDAAVKISRILRLAKIEEGARPKVIGAIILAMWQGDFTRTPSMVLEHINANVEQAIDNFTNVPRNRQKELRETLRLSTEAHPLREAIDDVVHQLERLNVRSIMRSGVDFLGKFYESFLRYGGDTKQMGIVFTPRHITRFCAELLEVRLGMTVYDPAAGTGGFLVAAFDRMWRQATTEEARQQVKQSLYGCDTNATVWALAVLNMFFRGDGKTNLVFGSCMTVGKDYSRQFDRVMLNPPFSQEGEPETDFVNHAIKSLKAGGEAAIILPASVLTDRTYREWRETLVENHQVLGVISLPPDLFYPVGAATVILLVRAHAPELNRGTFLAHISNDGFEISKKRRVDRPGSQLESVLALYRQFLQRGTIETIPGVACVVPRENIVGGGEIIAHRWLPSAPFGLTEFEKHRHELFRSMSLAVANVPAVTEELLADFEEALASGPIAGRPKETSPLSDWFEIEGGRTTESKTYAGGGVPYVSSGDFYNSIEDFLSPPEEEIFAEPCASITGFGQAYIQPWRFCARGGAGSAPHVLRPKWAMCLAELIWFVGQVNAQRWRFYYGRMATKTRLSLLQVDPPPANLPIITGLIERLTTFQSGLDDLYDADRNGENAEHFERLSSLWKQSRGPQATATLMAKHPAYRQIIAMGAAAIPLILRKIREHPDHWFIALKEISAVNPVRPENRGDVRRMADDWIAWGIAQGYLTDDEPQNVVS